ncbi:histidine kinase [Sphingomonas sp. ID1715]|uniref:sensor histidine kinase n=1 Tax=Sphingomonas sp. ID1715 TaxID=1656898 RepID=UPI00148919B1|nr:histidine kinase [Sphingomonas sp. ID1715]NNM78249.1 histidine kinase [Sphingomonas sp. ID1715]
MTEESSDRRRNARVGLEVAIYSILGFWLFYVLIATAQSFITGWGNQGELAQRRLAVTVAGIGITFLLYVILRRADDRSFGTRIAVAFVAAVPAAIAIAMINYYFFNVYKPEEIYADQAMIREMATHPKIWKSVAEIAVSRYFFLAAWAALYLAISYATETREAERRIAGFAQAAKEAEIRALRYQVNPHFLFNTLNSLSSLVMTDRNVEAESMIMNLSTFYRTSLSGDPMDDVPLSEEVRLQRLYLDIEAVRFPERLKTRIDVPEELMNLCVPGLILQPLVENAIKYGVSGVNRPVTIAITARSERGKLVLTVADDGKGPANADEHGTGVGLANVRDRLQARFGSRAGVVSHAPKEGGFVVTLAMPEVRGSC